MRKNIVAGEPGIFPWPFGRLYAAIGRWLHRRPSGEDGGGSAAASPEGPAYDRQGDGDGSDGR